MPETGGPLPSESPTAAPVSESVPAADEIESGSTNSIGESDQLYWWIGGLLAVLTLGLGSLLWRRRKTVQARRLPPPSIAETDSDETVGAAVAPPRLDIELEIVSASRSVMMFTLEYRLNFSNRSARAVRDLAISAKLASAERGETNAPPVAAGQPVGTIERIGPHQTRSIAGQMQLPVTDIRAILQGRKPIFIPLLHLTLESPGQPALTRSYVVGTPSAAAQGRLHPIPLDTPPGGVPGLKAREISLAA